MIKRFTICWLLLLFFSSNIFSSVYYVAPNGNDTLGLGLIDSPFRTIQRAQTSVIAGDTVYVRGGTYTMQESQIATYSSIWAYVTYLTKSGVSGKRINYWNYPGERPVFDYSNIKPANYRINAFEITGSWLYLKGLEVVGVQVTITNANTQSIGFATDGGSNIIYEQCVVHDGQAIGFYLTKGSNNLFLNCDAYRNNDYTSQSGGGINGGNVDGFGNHPAAGSVNNVYRGCRAWFNSDDGYDCISANEPTVFENCWSFYNGYAVGFVSRGDGNGFKAGGYGSTAFTSLPANIPRNTIRFCLAVRNKSNGFYSNHHLEGSDWYNNTSYLNAANFNMLNRKAKTQADYLTDTAGYNHVIRNNISYAPRSAGSDITNYDASRCTIDHNSFLNPGITVSSNDFVSLDTALLIAPREADGSLPNTAFMKLKSTSNLIDKGVDIGFPYEGSAPDLGCFEYTSSTLPVSMISFSGYATNPTAVLEWNVSNQIQNQGWEIERSIIKGSTQTPWEKVGFTAAIPGASKYLFNDKNAVIGTNLYRLKQVDLDGNFKYSNIVSIKISKAGSFSLTVFPVPVTNGSVVSYSVPAKCLVNISVYNAAGIPVATLVNTQQEAGSYQVQLDKNILPSNGVYFLKLTTNADVITKAFTK
jgi:parallel beta-helix repeat protein